MAMIKLNRRGQITIPREIRRQLGLHAGDTVALILEDGRAILLPMTKTLLDLRGSVTAHGAQDFASIGKKVIDERGRKPSPDE